MKLSDLTSIINKHSLPLIRSYAADDGCTVFEFDITGKKINWLAGQHGIFTLPKKKITGTKWRSFSISSIPQENVLQIATKIGDNPSSYKQALRSLKPGEEIQVRGPFGWLYLQDYNSPVVMIAGGVGITPFRAIFKEIERDNQRDVTLIYSARENFLYKDELDEIADKDKNTRIIYTHDKEGVNDALNQTLSNQTKDTYYFISGSPGMIKGIKSDLIAAGVKKQKILTDSFRGY